LSSSNRGPAAGSDTTSGELGIVLSGGGTHGIAHIGVLRALGENGIAPRRIAGTSAGAVAGALYAAGYPPDAMLEFFIRKNPFRLSKVSISKPGIIDTDKVVADFEEYFPDDSFGALEKELRVVATELTRGEAVVFDSGPLIRALLASASMPLMFTPMTIGDGVYADGGIINNFPVELLEGRCGVLLGVHAGPIQAIDPSELGSTLAVLKRALDVGMFRASEAKFGRCDVVVVPPGLLEYGSLDTRHMKEIERAGYDAASSRMPEIVSAIDAAGG
jgi:NTE family protein